MKELKKEKGTFNILNLTDTQLSCKELIEKGEYLEQWNSYIEQLVSKTNPDYITISGDLAYGDEENKQVYEYYVQVMDKFKKPWSVVWGNHDNQGGAKPIKEAVKVLSTSPYFLYESGDESMGNGNYVVTINDGEKVDFSIIFMDTHDRDDYVNSNGESEICYSKLNEAQLKWYEEKVNELKALGCKKSMLIIHIPIYAYKQAFEQAFNGEYDSNLNHDFRNYDKNCWKDEYKNSKGIKLEEICCCKIDDGVMDIIERLDHTKLIVCGHDHINTTMINYKGVLLAYALKTGHGNYFNENLNGGTLITIKDTDNFEIEHIYL